MEDLINQVTARAAKTIKNWWLILITGILSIATGIAVFCNPAEGYMTLSIFCGIFMLISGISDLVVAITSRNWFMTRGYNVAGGILDIFIGILLCSRPSITAALLPIFLGVWLLYHSFMLIGSSGDLKSFGVSGSGGFMAGGIITLILSLCILLNPFSFGVGVIVVFLGIAFILFGVVAILGSLRLRKIKNYIKEAQEVDEQRLDY